MLTLDTSDSIKLITQGAYQGQNAPLTLGENYIQLGPNYVGITGYDDAVEMNAYFDPDISTKTLIANQRIGYVQVGEVLFNDVPVPVDLYDPGYPVLSKGLFLELMPSFSDYHFTDAPDTSFKQPFFALWEKFYDESLTLSNLSRFPRQYGAFTARPFPSAPGNGLSKVAYMNNLVELTLRSLPGTYSVEDYMNEYAKPEDLGYTTFRLEQEIKDPNVLLDVLMQRKLIPPWANPSDKSYSFIHSTGDIYYLGYDAFDPAYYQKYSYYILVFPDPPGQKTTYGLAVLSEDLRELMLDEIINGPPDIPLIRRRLNSEFKIDIPNSGKFKITFRFLTYPCSIYKENPSANFYYLKHYEGFKWQISRTYDGGWNTPIISRPESANKEDDTDFYFKVNDFFTKYYDEQVFPLLLSFVLD